MIFNLHSIFLVFHTITLLFVHECTVMPKAKCFPNLLKSAPQPQSDVHPPTHAPINSTPAAHHTPLDPSPSIHATSHGPVLHPSPSMQTHLESPIERSPSVHGPPHDPAIIQELSHAPTSSSSERYVGCESTQYWSVEEIDTCILCIFI